MFVFGSHALAQYIDIRREPADIDVIGSYEEVETLRRKCRAKTFYPFNDGRKMFMKASNGKIIEADIAWPGSVEEKLLHFLSASREQRSSDYSMNVYGMHCDFPSMHELYMLKMSHRYLKDSPHFLKTMRDIQALRKVGAIIRPEHQDFYEQRMKDTYVYKHPSSTWTSRLFSITPLRACGRSMTMTASTRLLRSWKSLRTRSSNPKTLKSCAIRGCSSTRLKSSAT